MSSTRTTPRSGTNVNKATSSSSNTHHTNGSANTYDSSDSTANTSNISEIDTNLQKLALTKNLSQTEGIYRNHRFIHAITTGLMGQQVIIQTADRERFHGVLETISANGDAVLSVAHRLDNNNDIMGISTSLVDLFEIIDSSSPSFELAKRIFPASSIVEIIACDVDLTGSGKCMLEDNPKVTHLEDDRFNRMEHFYGSDDIDPDTFEDLDLGDDGKAGYDPEDMFHTNREKFNTTTDFDESKYTNVPVREMTNEELAEIDKKVMEIEKLGRTEDIDEDDAGVKRPSEYNQTPAVDDGNSNTKTNQSLRSHPADRRADSRYDPDYNPPKRGNWRDQRTGGGGGNRRGSTNYSMNNPKSNQRSEQTQYTSSRSSEQSTNNRQQQYKSRNNRFTDNRSPNEGRASPSQATNDETTRGQRINSGSFSQGQSSGPTSPSTTVPGRTIYSTNNRPPIGRNSPAPYTGSSSSRNNSTTASATATSPSPTTTTSASASTTSYQTSTAGTGNYSQQSNNKMPKKQTRNEPQSTTDETDQPKPQRNQQQTSSNNQSNTVPLNRPSHLHTQQIKQQQQQQMSSSNNNVPPSLTLPPQEDHSSSHEPINPNQSDPSVHTANPSIYAPHPTGTITPSNVKPNSDLNPEADEFVPGFPRESSSRPESRGPSVSSMPMNPYMSHAHPQALHLLQQQQQQAQQPQVQQPSMIPSTHPQNAAALYQYYQPSYTNMTPFINSAPQQMNISMMSTHMMPPQTQQSLPGTGPNANTVGTAAMATPSGGAGPTYKTNNNALHGGDTGNTGVNNIAPKKAVVSVQRTEPSNVSQQQQQQQAAGAPQMVYPPASIRYYPPDYMSSQGTPPSVPIQQLPFYYPINTSGIIQATAASGVGPPQNIMIPSAPSSTGPTTSAPSSIYYQGVYSDPRVYGVYQSPASVNPGGVNANWQMARSPPHQQQQPTDQQRAYVSGQNVVTQVSGPTGPGNTAATGGAGRSASTSGPSGQTNAVSGGPTMAPQYAMNGSIPTAYTYGSPAPWYSAQAQVPSPQTNMPPQVNAFGMMFDPSQQVPSQQPTYVHPNAYDAAYFQQSQQQLTQQGLDTVPPGSYNR